MKCQAAIANGSGSFSIEEIEVGLPQADEVLVEIHAAGICHTDHASLSWKRPLVMGHEGAGVILEVGSSIRHVAPGDKVVLNWAIPCGHCHPCHRGEAVLCETSRPAYVMERSDGHAHSAGTLWRGQPVDRSFNIGTLSGLTLVKGAAVTKIPREIECTAACIVGCGVMTGFGSAVNIARVHPGDSVVVIGCGGVGLNIIQGARIQGAGKIIALDRHQGGLENARRFGATETLLTQPEDTDLRVAAAEVHRRTGGRGADFAFEATSVPRLAFAPLLMIRNGGMALQVSGINEAVDVEMPRFMWNKTYLTPLYGGCVPERDFPRIFSLYQEGRLLLDELVTRTYPLSQLDAALNDMLEGRNAKGVIKF
jgi:Zn-dependent alcohol dehydrogenase